MSLRDSIFAASSRPSEPVTVPAWNLDGLAVRVMSAAERDSLNAESYALKQAAGGDESKALSNMTARLVARTLVGPDGNRIFTDADAEQLGREQPADVLAPIYEAAARLNKLGEPAVEESVKNSAAAPSGSFSST